MFDELVDQNMELWGDIPSYLDKNDPRPAVEQINEKSGNRWARYYDMKIDPVTMSLNPYDPSPPRSVIRFRDEQLFIYDGDWIIVQAANKSWHGGKLMDMTGQGD